MSQDLNSSLSGWGITGTEVHYFALCPRKLWWFSHGIEQEHSGGASGTSTAQENVALGTLLHEESYPGARRKDVLIDGLIRLDFTESGVVHEVKKSRGALHATRMQLCYYLYYLKHEKGIETTGRDRLPQGETHRESHAHRRGRERAGGLPPRPAGDARAAHAAASWPSR